jgi:2-amino-4-hydroxy-6-hydroxymethyldihydropteridine diphosphokinase
VAELRCFLPHDLCAAVDRIELACLYWPLAFVSKNQRHRSVSQTMIAAKTNYSPRCGRYAFVALGSNRNGPWGTPEHTVAATIRMLPEVGAHVKAVSENIITRPIGGPWQANFVNAVVLVHVTTAPATFLRNLKRLERAAGRRLGPRWGPRPLDLDIIDVGSAVNWSAKPHRRVGGARRRAGQFQCPHPEMHRRAFVLVPLAEIAPHWYHPVLRRSVRALLSAPAVRCQLTGLRRVKTN